MAAKKLLTIGVSGRGLLMGFFISDGRAMLPNAVFYERTERFLAAREQELRLADQGLLAPATSPQRLELPRVDIMVTFKDESQGNIRTMNVTVEGPNNKRRNLAFRLDEKRPPGGNEPTDIIKLFKSYVRKIADAVRSVS